MPNPLLVVNPAIVETEPVQQPFKLGEVVVRAWGKSKVAKNRCSQVVRVHTSKQRAYGTYYSYDIRHSNGMVDQKIDGSYYMTFEAYRKKINNNIQQSYKTIATQTQELVDAAKMEADAKKIYPPIRD